MPGATGPGGIHEQDRPARVAGARGIRFRAAENEPSGRSFQRSAKGGFLPGHAGLRLAECQDNPTLIAALRKLWESRPSGREFDQPYFVGVTLGELVPDRLHSLNLFDALDGEQRRTRLLAAMDALNNKYGLSTLAPATMLAAYKAAPTRIAFHSIPELF